MLTLVSNSVIFKLPTKYRMWLTYFNYGLHFTLPFSSCQPQKLKLVGFCRHAQNRGVKFVFYDQFVHLCQLKNETPTSAALNIGLSKSAPTKWKTSGATPRGETLQKIAAYFGVTESDLLSKEKIQPSFENSVSKSEVELRENLRTNYAMRILFDTADGASEADLLEAAALLARRKEERGI